MTNNFFLFASECAKSQNIELEDIIEILKDSTISVIKRKFGKYFDDKHFNVIVDYKHKEFQILHYIDIVSDECNVGENINLINISNAKRIEKDFNIGEQVVKQLSFDIFTRQDIKILKTLIKNQISVVKQRKTFVKYKKQIDGMIDVVVSDYGNRCIITHDLYGNEILLPDNEKINGERLRKKSSIKAVVKKVYFDASYKLRIIISRRSDIFLEKLLKFHIPEIDDGTIIIKKIARIPGKRSKVVVQSCDENVDPVGTCLGGAVIRLGAISKELNGEFIDFVAYSDNKSVFISNVLGVEVMNIKTFRKESADDPNVEKIFLVIYVNKDDVETAKGKYDINIKLLKILLGEENSICILEYSDNCADSAFINFLYSYFNSFIVTEILECKFLNLESILKTSKNDFERITNFEKKIVDNIYNVIEEQIEDNE